MGLPHWSNCTGQIAHQAACDGITDDGTHEEWISPGVQISTRDNTADQCGGVVCPAVNAKEQTCGTSECMPPAPILNLEGDEDLTIEASATEAYLDDGANCEDWINGQINDHVVVTGDIVNRAVPTSGTPYELTYNCVEHHTVNGNEVTLNSNTVKRYVHVVSTSCPTCTLDAPDALTIEASFPYSQTMPTCEDYAGQLEASAITSTVSGPAGSGATDAVNVEHTGVYVVEFVATDPTGNPSNGVGSTCTGGNETKQTIHVVDTLKPVIGLRFNNDPVFHSGDATDLAVHVEHDAYKTNPNPTNPVDGHFARRLISVAGIRSFDVMTYRPPVIMAGMISLFMIGVVYSRSVSRQDDLVEV